MKVLTANEIRQVEKISFERYFTEAQLMEKAGVECSKKIIKYFQLNTLKKNVVILCGNGKNGGDGFVIARELKNIDCHVKIVLTENEPTIEEPLMYYNKAIKCGVEASFYNKSSFENTDIIVDCIFGIGFHGKSNELYTEIFNAVNCSNCAVVSIDVPSGTNSTDGTVMGACIKADLTIAISTLKYAHILPPSNAYCGKIKVVDIGIAEDCYENLENSLNTITKKYVKSCFIPRDFNSNKGNFGKLLSVCGSMNMIGAAVISAKTAVKSGAGLVTCAFPKSAYSAITAHLIESTFLPLSENDEKTLSVGCLTKLLDEANKYSTVLVGCGLGQNDDISTVVSQLVKEVSCPLIIDADGINALLNNIDILREAKNTVILTPHPGEMARLIGKTPKYVQENRLSVAKDFAKKYNVILVLKGANTIVATPTLTFVNTTGNPAMAKGGSGDMLAGLISSFVAQGMSATDASLCGVYIHGVAGDVCKNDISIRGTTVSDMVNVLPFLLSQFE